MSELQEATLALVNSPVRTANYDDAEAHQAEAPRTPTSPPPHPTWTIPSHLTRIPSLRDAALKAVESGRAASESRGDFALILQHGLHLQDLASRLGPSFEDDQLTLLHRACEVYGLANDVRQARSAVTLFNWAVALSDIARLVKPKQPGEAAEYLSAAALKYAAAVAIDPLNPQALNNWALILQDLAALMPPHQRRSLIAPAVARFRAAIRLQPDAKLMSRFSYNLGTVLYSDCCLQADRLAENVGAKQQQLEQQQNGGSVGEKKLRAAFAHAGQYIMLAYALQPDAKVYQDALPAVQRLLPLPYLRAGALMVAIPSTADTASEAWVEAWFALDSHMLQSVRPPPTEASRMGGTVPDVAIEVADITAAHVFQDPSLPEGWAVWLALKDRTGGVFLVAEEREDAEGWVDALRLLGVVGKSRSGGAEQLEQALMARRTR